MRLSRHIFISSVAALAVARRRAAFPWLAWGASILVDVDHYLWYGVQTGRVHPLRAWRHFRQEEVRVIPQGRLLFHHPAVLILLGLLGLRLRPLQEVAAGVLFHNLLDEWNRLWRRATRAYRRRRRQKLQIIVFAREHYRCQHCGRQGPPLELHHRLPEALGGRNHPDNLLALCPSCHDRAHGRQSANRPSS
ncbi:MAG: HNH endonuclease [Caldilineae bacterium]|nr:MAG: HNH endonuclease [Caldilineae bacterium]